jgi:hypothetical protein
VINGILSYKPFFDVSADLIKHLVVISVCLLFVTGVAAQAAIDQGNAKTITIKDVPDQEVIIFAKDVIVVGEARGVLVFGGDITILGRVTGDVGAIGGSIVQKEQGMIGGDVFVIGGSYKPEANEPLRGAGRETLVYAGYEEELRAYAQQPSLLFAPAMSWSFLVQRLFSLLFWFSIGLLITMISPGAVSRAAARIRIKPLTVVGVGSAGLLLATVGVIASVGLFPGFIGGILGLMAFIFILLSYVFGRTVLQVAIGKILLKTLKPKAKASDTYSILCGAFVLTLLLSLPYLWIVALFVLFASSIGLIITVRSNGILASG